MRGNPPPSSNGPILVRSPGPPRTHSRTAGNEPKQKTKQKIKRLGKTTKTGVVAKRSYFDVPGGVLDLTKISCFAVPGGVWENQKTISHCAVPGGMLGTL